MALADAVRARDAEPLLSWQRQSVLLDHAISVLGERSTDHGSPEVVDVARAAILRAVPAGSKSAEKSERDRWLTNSRKHGSE